MSTIFAGPASPSAPGLVRQTEYNVLAAGLVADGSTDNTAALNALLATVSAAGGGTIYSPPGFYRFSGQIIVPANSSGNAGQQPVRLTGAISAGTGVIAASKVAGAIWDLRYDGTTGDAVLHDYAVISGLDAVWTSGGTTLAVSAGTAYINNLTTTDPPTALAASSAVSVAGLANGDYWADYDGTTLGLLAVGTGSNDSTLQNGASIRLYRVSVASGVLTNVMSLRGRVAKIETRHYGHLQIDNLTLCCLDTVRTSDEVPLLRTTLTRLVLDTVTFQGSAPASFGTSALQDAVHLGGPGGPAGYSGGTFNQEAVTATSIFGGYGTVIRNCVFASVRRALYLRAAANAVFAEHLTIWSSCGADGSKGAIELDSPVLSAHGNVIRDVLLEAGAYTHAVLCQNNVNNNLLGGVQAFDAYTTKFNATVSVGATSIALTDAGTPGNPLAWLNKPVCMDWFNPSTKGELGILGAALTGTVQTTLSAPASISDTTVTVTSAAGLTVGQSIVLDGATQEWRTISQINSTTLTLSSALAAAHSGGANLLVAPWVVPTTALIRGHAATDNIGSLAAVYRFNKATATNNTVVGGQTAFSFLASDTASDAGQNAWGQTVFSPDQDGTLTSELIINVNRVKASQYMLRMLNNGSDKFRIDTAGSLTSFGFLNQWPLDPQANSQHAMFSPGHGLFGGATGGFSGSSAGTIYGANLDTGGTADFANYQLYGAARFKVDNAGIVTGVGLTAAGLTGATAASRYVGATTSGAPASGTFVKGDFVVDQTATVWVCTTGGTPGTWAQLSALPTLHAATHAPGGTDDLQLSQGHMSATRLETFPRYAASSGQTLVSQTMVLSYLTSPVALTVGYLVLLCSTGASGGSLVRFGIYSVAANGDITLVARTASDTTLLNSSGVIYVKALDTTGGFPATYTMAAGQRYALAVLAVGATPAVRGIGISVPAFGALSPAMCRAMASQADLPTGTTATASLASTALFPWAGASTNSSGN